MRKLSCLFFFVVCFNVHAAMDVYCNGAPTTIHPNGGGNIALTALVDSTVIVGPNASVCEYASVFGNSQIGDSARVYGYARVSNGTIVSGTAEVYGNATLTSNSPSQIVRVSEASKVFGNAIVLEGASVKTSARVFENARVSGNATIDETAQVYGSATVTGTAQIKGTSKIHGTAYIGSNTVATGTTDICVITRHPVNTVLTNIVNCPSSPALESTSQIVAGGTHTCVLLANGRMKCWGNNINGQLGLYLNTGINIGDDELPKTKSYVASGVEKISAGLSHTCSIILGNAYCWGLGTSGQLGRGSLVSTEGISGAVSLNNETVKQIVAGSAHTCALLESKKVRCWGDNTFGQLGYGDKINRPSPGAYVEIADTGAGEYVTQITAGSFHTCALLNTNNIRCWGKASEGQLGYGNLDIIGDNELPKTAPLVNFHDNSNDNLAIQVAAGASHTCVLTVVGNVRCWGLNSTGQLGYGYTINVGDDEFPFVAGDVNLGGRPVSKLSSGLGNHTCAVLTSGKIYCWGSNNNGQLGYGNINNVGDDEIPLDVDDVKVGDDVTQVTIGVSHTCALLSTKGVRCWGLATSGQLGYGNTNTIGDNELPSSIGNVASQLVEKSKKHWRRNEN